MCALTSTHFWSCCTFSEVFSSCAAHLFLVPKLGRSKSTVTSWSFSLWGVQVTKLATHKETGQVCACKSISKITKLKYVSPSFPGRSPSILDCELQSLIYCGGFSCVQMSTFIVLCLFGVEYLVSLRAISLTSPSGNGARAGRRRTGWMFVVKWILCIICRGMKILLSLSMLMRTKRTCTWYDFYRFSNR